MNDRDGPAADGLVEGTHLHGMGKESCCGDHPDDGAGSDGGEQLDIKPVHSIPPSTRKTDKTAFDILVLGFSSGLLYVQADPAMGPPLEKVGPDQTRARPQP